MTQDPLPPAPAKRFLILMGMRGCGKSTIGPLLATRCNLPFFDLDECCLAALAAESVVAVWNNQGEAAWRETEVATLAKLLAGEPSIIALGGGTPMITAAAEIVDAARSCGRVATIYINVDAAIIEERLLAGQDADDRPSLTGRTVYEEVAEVLALRHPTYQSLADITVDGRHPAKEVVTAIINALAANSPDVPDRHSQ
ncbi:MAG: shikimate kinase [Phycisphaerales bacterium]